MPNLGPVGGNFRAGPSASRNFFTVEHCEAPYTRWSFQIAYHGCEGLVQMPVAEKPAGDDGHELPCEVVRHSAPYGSAVITWSAERQSRPPLLPAPVSRDRNVILEKYWIGPLNPELMEDGLNRLYRRAGEYRYILKVPPWYLKGLWAGWAAYDTQPPEFNVLSAADFRQVF